MVKGLIGRLICHLSCDCCALGCPLVRKKTGRSWTASALRTSLPPATSPSFIKYNSVQERQDTHSFPLLPRPRRCAYRPLVLNTTKMGLAFYT